MRGFAAPKGDARFGRAAQDPHATKPECVKHRGYEWKSIKRTTATLRDPQGRSFEVTKGAPPVVLRLAHNYHAIREALEAVVDDYAERGVRCIAVARTDEHGRLAVPVQPCTCPVVHWVDTWRRPGHRSCDMEARHPVMPLHCRAIWGFGAQPGVVTQR